jgi:hypothetical protein
VGGQIQAQLFGVDHRGLVGNDTLCHQSFDATRARCSRQAYPLSQLKVAETGVFLQNPQNTAIKPVQQR